MKPRIAVISTPMLTDYLRDALVSHEGRAAFSFMTYVRSDELIDIYARVLPRCDGLLVAGIIPFALLGRLYPDLGKPVRCCSLDYETYAEELLGVLIEDRTLPPERIYVDFLGGKPITEFIGGGHLAEVGASYLSNIAAMDVDTLLSQRDRLVADVKARHSVGGVELVLTRFATVVDELTEFGIDCRVIRPGRQYVALTAEHLLGDLRLIAMEGARPAAIAVTLQGDDDIALLACQQALLRFARDRALDFVLRPGRGVVEILTTAKDVYVATGQLTTCSLHPHLSAEVGDVTIGYGIGEDATRALSAAYDALKVAQGDAGCPSYVVDGGRLIGPLDGDRHVLVTEASPELALRARQADLSPMTLQRVVAVARALGEEALTARILSERLGVTTRAAARYLSKLVQAGEAEVVGHRQMGGRGRPEQLIHIIERNGGEDDDRS